MPANKQFVSIANQLPILAKAYYNYLSGTPEEIAKKQQQLLKLVQKLDKELRLKGSALVKAPVPSTKSTKSAKNAMASAVALGGSSCPPELIECADGTCVPTANLCGSE